MKKRYTFFSKNLLRLGSAAALILSISTNSKAQNGPAKMWDKTFGGSDQDGLTSVSQTSDGGYIMAGSSNSSVSGDKSAPNYGPFQTGDFWVVKIDGSGNKQWDKTFGGNGDETHCNIQQTSDGGYILGGTSGSGISGDKSQPSKGGPDYWILKLDANGNKIWDKTIGSTSGDRLRSLQQTSDGGYILGGDSSVGTGGDKSQPAIGKIDYWIVKLDASGIKQWDKTFGGFENDNFKCVRQTSDGGYILGGESISQPSGDKSQPSKGGYDYWVIKIDSNGNKTWEKTIGGIFTDYLSAIQPTADGGYILGGATNSGVGADKSQPSKGSTDFWIIKIDKFGNKLWDKTIGGNSTDFLYSISSTLDGGFVVGGQSSSGISGDKSQVSQGAEDFWFVKINSVGNIVWDKTLGGGNNDAMFSIQQTSDGGYVLGGGSGSGISGDKSQAAKGGGDMWIIKLGPDVLGINDSFSDSQLSISPNPSHGKFSLQLKDISAPKVEVSVSDLLGRVIWKKAIPVSNKQISEELEIKAAKGMYLLQVEAGNQTTSRKIVVE